MSTATVCDNCAVIINEGAEQEEVITTDSVHVSEKMKHPNYDYCSRCRDKMIAEAGLKLWDTHKQVRKVKNDEA